MPREKMIPKSPVPVTDGTPENSLERMKQFARRLIAVPKDEVARPKKKRRHR